MQKATKEKALDRDSEDAGHALTFARDTKEAMAASAAPNGSSYANGETVPKNTLILMSLLQVSIAFSSSGDFQLKDRLSSSCLMTFM